MLSHRISKLEDLIINFLTIQPYEFIAKNDLTFFQGNVIKYVCRYKHKNGIEDLEKIKHYCELDLEMMFL